MKKFFIFLLCFATFSCVMDDGEKVEGKRTRAAYQIFDYTQRTINSQMDAFYLAQHLDLYINALTDEERYAIEDKYFPNKKIRKESENSYRIYDSYSMWIVDTGGRKLAEVDAQWRLSNRSEQKYSEKVECAIEYNDDKKWRMKHESAFIIEDEDSSCNYEILKGEEDEYFIQGVGKYREKDCVVEYEIIDPILSNRYSNPRSLVKGKGKMRIVLTKSSNSTGESISVDLTTLGRVGITYRGITEIW